MEMDEKKAFCPILDVDGVISGGKQFDLDITLPEDNREVIYGIVKDCFKEPVKNAVVKLVEIIYEHDKEERRPIGHTFTDKEGEFVFGPLCPGKVYALQIWVNDTKKIKICAKCHHEGKCLKGEKCDKCDCFMNWHKDWDKCDKKEDKCDKKEDKCDWDKDECKDDEKKHDKCDCFMGWHKDWEKCDKKEDKCDKKEDKCDCDKKCKEYKGKYSR